ncbi:MAG: hypothetical protein QME68_07850 [Elusimicrobiota bacterium]|nr:hypothetical protein [Elusimicrobiota bacterium]
MAEMIEILKSAIEKSKNYLLVSKICFGIYSFGVGGDSETSSE